MLSEEIKETTKKLTEIYKIVKPARDKIIVHINREAHLERKELGEVPTEIFEKFFKNIEKYCDLGSKALNGYPIKFDPPIEGDVHDFLMEMKKYSAMKSFLEEKKLEDDFRQFEFRQRLEYRKKQRLLDLSKNL